MVNKLKLSFFIDSDLETPEKEAEAARWFDSCRRMAFENFTSELSTKSDEAGLLTTVRAFLETPERLHILDEMSAKKVLAELAQNKIFGLLGAIDEALFELTKEGVKPEAAFLLPKRFERLRAEFEIWREAMRNGNFEVYQTRPYEKMPEYFQTLPELKNQYTPALNGMFPTRRFSLPWKPEAAKVQKEPEEFRQIWLNPEEDIPFVLAALKDLEFIDENEVWRWNTKEDNPRGVIEAIHLYSNLFSDFSGEHRARVFRKRFKFPNPEKRFEKKGDNYKRAMAKMANYLKNKP